MAYVEQIEITRGQFAALISSGAVLDRPVWFRITDARDGEPGSYLGVPNQSIATIGATGLLNQPPRVTSVQRDAMRDVQRGTMIFNLTTDVFEYFSLSGWTIL